MTHLKLSEAKAHLGHYAKQVKEGMSFILTDRNEPVASLVPLQRKRDEGIQPKFGLADKMIQFHIPENFNEPIESFENDFYKPTKNP